MKKILKAVIVPVLMIMMGFFTGADAFAEGQPGFIIAKIDSQGQPVFDTASTETPSVFVEDASCTDGSYIGGRNCFVKQPGRSVIIYLESDGYRIQVFEGNQDEYENKYKDSDYYAYNWNGEPISYKALKDEIARNNLKSLVWVKGDVQTKTTVTFSTTPEELAYSADGKYYLNSAVFSASGSAVTDPALKAYVLIDESEITDDYIEKEIKLTGNSYKLLDPTVKAKVKVTRIDASTLPKISFGTINRVHYATGYEVCPVIDDDVQCSDNGVVRHLFKGKDFDVSYGNNIYPTTSDNRAYAVMTFKGHYKGELKFYFDIIKGDLEAECNLSVADWYEGDTPSVPSVTSEKFYMANNEAGEITYTYYKGSASLESEAEKLSGVPTEKGKYFVKAELPAGKLFKGKTLKASFEIKEKAVAPAPSGNTGNNESNNSSQSNTPATSETPRAPEENAVKSVVNAPAPIATTPAAAPVAKEAPVAKVETAVAELPTEVPVEAKEKLIEKVTETVTKLVEAIAEDASTIENAVSSETLEKVKAAIEDGKEITASVTVNVVEENSIPSEDKEKIDSVISEQSEKNLEVACYLDLSIMLITGDGEELGTYNELTGTVTFTIAAPKDMECPEGKEYVVIRIHNGESTILPVTVNADGTLSFETDLLSSYALAVMDIATKEEVEAPVEASEEVTEETSKEETVEAEIVEEEAPLSGSTFNVKYVILFVAAFAAIGAALYFVISKNNVNKAK